MSSVAIWLYKNISFLPEFSVHAAGWLIHLADLPPGLFLLQILDRLCLPACIPSKVTDRFLLANFWNLHPASYPFWYFGIQQLRSLQESCDFDFPRFWCFCISVFTSACLPVSSSFSWRSYWLAFSCGLSVYIGIWLFKYRLSKPSNFGNYWKFFFAITDSSERSVLCIERFTFQLGFFLSQIGLEPLSRGYAAGLAASWSSKAYVTFNASLPNCTFRKYKLIGSVGLNPVLLSLSFAAHW